MQIAMRRDSSSAYERLSLDIETWDNSPQPALAHLRGEAKLVLEGRVARKAAQREREELPEWVRALRAAVADLDREIASARIAWLSETADGAVPVARG